jgi:aspartate kinase
MRVLVQKFGGTSVASPESRLQAAEHIERALAQNYRVVVVVSAMGRHGDPYATDTLINTVQETAAVDKRDMDILMSCGEAISSVVFASMLRARGHEVTVFTGQQAGIVTDPQFGNARIVEIRPIRIFTELELGRIVVVMGFQGGTTVGDITTLGRGGSDTTATALGVALDAEFVDIFTDVDGIMTADPRIVSGARRLNQVSYAEICNLAYQGAKVIHPRAVEIAMQKNIPIRVRSTQSLDEGTLVTSVKDVMEHSILNDRQVIAVTQTAHVTQLKITGPSVNGSVIFQTMATHGISVDFFNVTPQEVVYTVAHQDTSRAVQSLETFGVHLQVLPECAKVSVVGAGIAGTPGIMARIVTALSNEGIEILQSADSHTTVWCLVHQTDMARAVSALHDAFELGLDDSGGLG